MGWFLSRSKKVGPFRLNFSRSGVGVSVGMRGFRVGRGARGNYVSGSGPLGMRFRSNAGSPGAGGAMLVSVLTSLISAILSALSKSGGGSRRRRR